MVVLSTEHIKRRTFNKERFIWLGLILAVCLCIAFADFSTKGEPREALVAVNMLNSGNWILPIDAAGDMSYKPPLMHWLIAAFSLPVGHVTEFASRLPSALALVALICISAKFYTAVNTRRFGIMCAALLLSCFEVMRAGTVARVDMLLTLFIVGALFAFYYSSYHHKALNLLIAVLCMSLGTLTKGPVAIILPLGVYYIWRLMEGDNFFKLTWLSVLLLASALILPLCWYYAAYEQGGDKFLTLAMEENFGRFTGQMSYESHVKPFWYNIISLLTGLLPWSALILVSFCIRPVRRFLGAKWLHLTHLIKSKSVKGCWLSLSSIARFSVVALIIIFIFYSIPKSKRSVYLLPMYPFMAYALGCYMRALFRSGLLSGRVIKMLIVSILSLYFIGFGIVFPIFTKVASDKDKAQHIEAVIPHNASVYSFIPDRFMRFYNIDFYMSGRLKSLLPSGQTSAIRNYDASMMRCPDENIFYLLTTEDIYTSEGKNNFGLSEWIKHNNLDATPVYISTFGCRDVKGKCLLLKVIKHS